MEITEDLSKIIETKTNVPINNEERQFPCSIRLRCSLVNMVAKGLLVLLSCFIQAFVSCNASPPSRWMENIIDRYRPRIVSISFEIQAEISTADIIHEEKNDRLSHSQVLVESKIRDAIFVLETTVNQTIADADNPEDLQNCLHEENVAQKELEKRAYDHLQECPQASQDEVTDLERRIGLHKSKLAELQRTTDLIIRKCTRQSSQHWQQNELSMCLRNRVDETERRLNRLKVVTQKIKEKSQELLDKLTSCVKAIDEDIVSNTLAILEEFSTCVRLLTSESQSSSEEDSKSSKGCDSSDESESNSSESEDDNAYDRILNLENSKDGPI